MSIFRIIPIIAGLIVNSLFLSTTWAAPSELNEEEFYNAISSSIGTFYFEDFDDFTAENLGTDTLFLENGTIIFNSEIGVNIHLGIQNALYANANPSIRLITDFKPNTKVFAMEVASFLSPSLFEVVVTGNSGISTFTYSLNSHFNFLGFIDLSGLISVKITGLSNAGYAIDNIATLVTESETVNFKSEAVTMPVSVSSGGEMGNEESYYHSISADGRFIAFLSLASDLIEDDENEYYDIFLRDRLNNTTIRISENTFSKNDKYNASGPSISADGRYVAFTSSSRVTKDDVSDYWDVFVYDRINKTTELISVNSMGEQGHDDSAYPAISADGGYIAMTSWATNLVDDDTNGVPDIFVHDRVNRSTERISINSLGEQGNNRSYRASISANGRYIAFPSDAANLVDDDTNGVPDIFVHDRVNRSTERISINSMGEQGNAKSSGPKMSADGRYIAFTSWATNLVSLDSDRASVFVHDRFNGNTHKVGNSSSSASISANGQYVTFATGYIFIYDRSNDITETVIDGNDRDIMPLISADGNFLSFTTYSTNLVSNEDNNDAADILVRGPLILFEPIESYHISFESTSWPERWYSYGWSQDDAMRSEGTYSLKSNPIADNSIAVTEWRVNIAKEGSLSFDMKVDSEKAHDFFRLYIDDALKLQRSGFVNWSEYTLPLASGDHILRFEYQKDSSNHSGADTAWIDNIRFTSGLLIESYHEIQKTLIERFNLKYPGMKHDNTTVAYQLGITKFSSPMDVVLDFIHGDAFQTQDLNNLSDSDIEDLADLLYLIYLGSAADPTELDYWSTQRSIREFDLQEFLQRQKFSDLTD